MKSPVSVTFGLVLAGVSIGMPADWQTGGGGEGVAAGDFADDGDDLVAVDELSRRR
jgi:hypothetical protein